MTDVPAPAVPGRMPLVAAAPWPRADARLRVLAMAVTVLTLAGVAAVLTVAATMPAERAAQLNSSAAASLQMVGMAGLAVAGAALARQQPRAAIAWLMLGTALAWVLSYLVLLGALTAHSSGSDLAPAAGWLTNWTWVPAQAVSMVLLLRFPTGRLPGRRWRPVGWSVLAWAGATVLVTATVPGPLGPRPWRP